MATSNLTEFGREVKKKLVDKEMSQVELAQKLGCSKQYLHKILTGERSGERYFLQIIKILGMDTL